MKLSPILCAWALALAAVAMSADDAFARAGDPIGSVGVGLGRKPNPSAIIARGTTDNEGNFSFGNLSAGDYVLTILPAQLQQQKIGVQDAELSVAAGSAGQRTIPKVVSATQAVSGITFTVAAGGTISGRLYRGATTNKATPAVRVDSDLPALPGG